MKELRDLKDMTIHDVQFIRNETTTGRRHSFLHRASGCRVRVES